MERTLGLLHWRNDTLRVEAFCEGADKILDAPGPDNTQESQLSSEVEGPKAWVSDRNYWMIEDGIDQEHWYDSDLDHLGFYRVLQSERFRVNSAGEMIGPSRQVHVINPSGASILAILRTAPHPHVDGLSDLISNYISSSPSPNLSMRVSDFWNPSFVINYNLPFFAIGPSSKQDKRVFPASKDKFRARYPLDSLKLQDPRSRLNGGDTLSFQEKLVLHEAVWALTTTGPSEPHWTAYCFHEDFFDEKSLSLEEQKEEEEDTDEEDEDSHTDDDYEDYESQDVGVDPIIDEAELRVNTWLPRQYSLTALAKQLDRIVGYHSHIHEVFKHNLEIYMASARDGSAETIYPSVKPAWKGFPELLTKVIFCNLKLIEAVENFLEKDVQLSQDGTPQGALWQSLRNNPKAMKSLRAIQNCIYRLRITGGKLEQIKESFEELRREKKFDQADEQKDRDKRSKEFAIAAFVFGILTLIAQVYSGKPQKNDKDSWPLFMAMVVLFVVICTGVFEDQLKDMDIKDVH
ncbi:arginyl-trna synthetase [Fusarium beomiforme]|uniref:Arginyl-trna synthetase n=1 Tax=Fusarium beomiforme TaxID=44412 RepID=A0A9P5AR70_9HYPO|nr:arginyl-trna synthetase [Fusarium beomiforme]